VRDNKVNRIQDIDVLKNLTELAEISFENNPICIHENISQIVEEVCPNLEAVNDVIIKDAGSRYKQAKELLLRQL